MKNRNFSVTYEIVTPESAEHGEADERGLIVERGELSLRDCISELFKTRTNLVGGIESIEVDTYQHSYGAGGYARVYNSAEFETGAHESRVLHFASNLTPASCNRLAKLIKSI